jgi:hypothetical protein
MTDAVKEAVEEIKQTFAGHPVSVEEEEQGGAHVTVGELPIGSQYEPEKSRCSFTITFQYPYADVYPHFLDANVVRKDRQPHKGGFSVTTWRDRPVLQISRRSNHRNPLLDTAAVKLLKVLQWIQEQ